MTILDMYLDCFKDIPFETELTRKEIIQMIQNRYDVDDTSILPSDLCYNSSNKGVEGNGKPRLFLKKGRGLYIYVGTNYDSSNVNPNE